MAALGCRILGVVLDFRVVLWAQQKWSSFGTRVSGPRCSAGISETDLQAWREHWSHRSRGLGGLRAVLEPPRVGRGSSISIGAC